MKKMEISKNLKDILFLICILSFLFMLVVLFVPGFDIRTHSFVSGIQTEGLLKIADIITYLGSGTFVAVFSLIVVLFFCKKSAEKSIFYLISVCGAVLTESLLKIIIQRPRPIGAILETGFSFPSAHATGAMAVYGALAVIAFSKYKKLDWKAYSLFFLALLVGLSRLYLGVHWLSDVLGGFFVGALWIFIADFILKKIN